MHDQQSVNGRVMPCSEERRASQFTDMQQMAKITARSAYGYLVQPELFKDNNIDPQIKGVLQSMQANAEDLHALISKRAA